MITIYTVWNNGQDGTDKEIICYALTADLAKLISHGHGTMGYGDGTIDSVLVYETIDELPQKLKGKIRPIQIEKLNEVELLIKLKALFSENELEKIKTMFKKEG